MQLCICKHVRSIHTHCLITFATISETFIEIVILYAHGALINQLNLLWWVWFKRYATMHLQTSICNHIWDRRLIIVCKFGSYMILVLKLFKKIFKFMAILKHKYCSANNVKSYFFAIFNISETLIEIVILYAHGALINQLNLLWWVWFKRYATMHLQTCS